MHPRLTELVDYLDAQRSALVTAAASIPADQWMERPAPDRWSMAELFEHLARVERGCARLIHKRASEAQASGHPAETETGSVARGLDGVNLTERRRGTLSPERVAPKGGLTHTQAVEALAASRAELTEAIRTADGLALGTIRDVHPRLGEIDLYQWILFVGKHEQRHVPQATEIAQQLADSAR